MTKTDTTGRAVVAVEWDGHCHPIWRYQDELHLPDHEQTRPVVHDPTRANCFAPACRRSTL